MFPLYTPLLKKRPEKNEIVCSDMICFNTHPIPIWLVTVDFYPYMFRSMRNYMTQYKLAYQQHYHWSTNRWSIVLLGDELHDMSHDILS